MGVGSDVSSGTPFCTVLSIRLFVAAHDWPPCMPSKGCAQRFLSPALWAGMWKADADPHIGRTEVPANAS